MKTKLYHTKQNLTKTIPVSQKAIFNDNIQDQFLQIRESSDSSSNTFIYFILFSAFLGGIILNLMPCVFPVLGLKVYHFITLSQHRKTIKPWHHAAVFTLGILTSFWALGAILFSLRIIGYELGWGFQLQMPLFIYSLAFV